MRSIFFVLIAAGSIANANPVPYGDDLTSNDEFLAAADVPDSNYPSSNYGDDITPPKGTYDTEKVAYKTEEQPLNSQSPDLGIGNNINSEYQPADLAWVPGDYTGTATGTSTDVGIGWAALAVGTYITVARGFQSISRAIFDPHYQKDSVAGQIQKLCDPAYQHPICSADISNPAPGTIHVEKLLDDTKLYKSVQGGYLIGNQNCGKGTEQRPIYPMCCQGFHDDRQAALGGPAQSCYVVPLPDFLTCVSKTYIDPHRIGN